MENLPQSFIEKLKSVTAKRPATIIKHILEHGKITSEEIKELYGYNHPPRAIRDVREHGIPVVTFRVKDNSGRSIAAYKFGDPNITEDTTSKSLGRTAFSKALRKALIDRYGTKCFIYQQSIDASLLQIDHRIPYEIAGNIDNVDAYMLLCPSANRAKSWTCEHCPNWTIKDINVCENCFWASPENYNHIAGNQERRIVLTFSGKEIEDYDNLIRQIGLDKAEETIKKLLHDALKREFSQK